MTIGGDMRRGDAGLADTRDHLMSKRPRDRWRTTRIVGAVWALALILVTGAYVALVLLRPCPIVATPDPPCSAPHALSLVTAVFALILAVPALLFLSCTALVVAFFDFRDK